MSAEVHVERRAHHGNRCAYCHGALEEPLARCESCQVECHADCARQLGRCPTLGCEAATIRAGPFAPLPSLSPLEASGVAAASEGHSPATRALALGALPGVRATAASLGVLALSGLLLALTTHHVIGPEKLGAALALVTAIAAYFVLALGAGLRGLRLAAAAPTLPRLLRDPGRPGELRVEPYLGKRGWVFHGSISVEGREPEAIWLGSRWDEPWLLHRQVVPVTVRGSGAGNRMILESRAGLFALVARRSAPRRTPPPPSDPRSVRGRARRGWRS